MSLDTAKIFALRTVSRFGGEPGGVAIVLERETAAALRQQLQLVGPEGIEGFAGHLQHVFGQGSAESLNRAANIVNISDLLH